MSIPFPWNWFPKKFPLYIALFAVRIDPFQLAFAVHCALVEFSDVVATVWPLELAFTVDVSVLDRASVETKIACR
jgi:hypothetical protein